MCSLSPSPHPVSSSRSPVAMTLACSQPKVVDGLTDVSSGSLAWTNSSCFLESQVFGYCSPRHPCQLLFISLLLLLAQSSVEHTSKEKWNLSFLGSPNALWLTTVSMPISLFHGSTILNCGTGGNKIPFKVIIFWFLTWKMPHESWDTRYVTSRRM